MIPCFCNIVLKRKLISRLSYASLLLLFGRIGDIVGHKLVFLCGTAWFAAWSLASAFAPKSYIFILFIACTGIGVAANTPAAIALCTHYFPAGAARNRALGIIGGAQPIGFILGLVLGGLIAGSHSSWRTIFYIQTGCAVLFITLGAVALPSDKKEGRYSRGIDLGGVILSVSGLGLLTFSIATAPSSSKGWATPYIPVLLVVSIALLVFFVLLQHIRTKANKSVLIPMKASGAGNGRNILILTTVFFGWWSFDTLIYFFTLYFQQVQFLSPIETSVRFIPMVISGVVMNVGTGLLMGKFSLRILMLIGLVGNMASAIIYALIKPQLSYWKMSFLMTVLDPFCDILYPIGTLLLTSSFDADSQALAGGLFNVATALGPSVGLAVTSSITTAIQQKYASTHPSLSLTSPDVLLAGFRAAGWTCFASASLSFIIVLVGLRGLSVGNTEVSPGPSRHELESRQENLGDGVKGLQRSDKKQVEVPVAKIL